MVNLSKAYADFNDHNKKLLELCKKYNLNDKIVTDTMKKGQTNYQNAQNVKGV